MNHNLLYLPDDILFCIISKGDCKMIHYLMKTSKKFKSMIVSNLFNKNYLSYNCSLNLGLIVNSTIERDFGYKDDYFKDLLHITYFIVTNFNKSMQWKSNIYYWILKSFLVFSKNQYARLQWFYLKIFKLMHTWFTVMVSGQTQGL